MPIRMVCCRLTGAQCTESGDPVRKKKRARSVRYPVPGDLATSSFDFDLHRFSRYADDGTIVTDDALDDEICGGEPFLVVAAVPWPKEQFNENHSKARKPDTGCSLLVVAVHGQFGWIDVFDRSTHEIKVL